MGELKDIFDRHSLNASHLLVNVKDIARHAGENIIMKIYESSHSEEDMGLEIKQDNSPVTKADKQASDYIVGKLGALTPGMAVVSEENTEEEDWGKPYWAVDPLDGTKLFAEKHGGFAVNIALMLEGVPVLGVVYCPVARTMYYSHEGIAAFKQEGDQRPQVIGTAPASRKGDLKTVFDAAHNSKPVYDKTRLSLINDKGLRVAKEPELKGLLPLNLLVAEGKADIHVKTGSGRPLTGCSGRVWDNAADYIILKNAGGCMIDITTGEPLKFDRGRERMAAYVAVGDISLGINAYPKMKNHCQ